MLLAPTPDPAFFCVWGGLGFELRASHLQNRPSIASVTSLVHFILVILEIRSRLLPRPAWTVILLFRFLPLLGGQTCTTQLFFSVKMATLPPAGLEP
jgi:hypothetical protein